MRVLPLGAAWGGGTPRRCARCGELPGPCGLHRRAVGVLGPLTHVYARNLAIWVSSEAGSVGAREHRQGHGGVPAGVGRSLTAAELVLQVALSRAGRDLANEKPAGRHL